MTTPRKQAQNTLDVQKRLENKHQTSLNKNMRISRGKRTKTLKTCVFPVKNRGFAKCYTTPPLG
jgi:hypothetical protein